MRKLSCSNCWHNGLQYDSVGLSVGYCVAHQIVLREADHITCGRHLRKDLSSARASECAQLHKRHFQSDHLVLLDGTPLNGASHRFIDPDPTRVWRDPVGEKCIEYNPGPGLENSTKIGALAALNELHSARGELAFLSLSRSYVRVCKSNGGPWTSGINLLWYCKKRIGEVPSFSASDFRMQVASSTSRQEALAQWSLMMLRLCFVGDVASNAKEQGHELGEFADTPEEAAAEASTSLSKLRNWISRSLRPRLDKKLSWEKYSRIQGPLRQESA